MNDRIHSLTSNYLHHRVPSRPNSLAVSANGWDSPLGYIADFYAGDNQNSVCAVAWQWISGSADYDQVSGSRIASGEGGACDYFAIGRHIGPVILGK